VPAVMTAFRNPPVNVQVPIHPIAQTAWYEDWKVWLAVGLGVAALGAGVFVLTKKD
jgi:hypothetical protein